MTEPNEPADMEAPAQRSNSDWVASIRDQDSHALEDLRLYLCRALQGSLANRPNKSSVEDYAQQALVRVGERIDRFRGDSRFTTWATAIAIRIALTDLRRKHWQDASLDAAVESDSVTDSIAAIPAAADKDSAHDELLRALQEGIETALTERQRDLVLAELEGVPSVVLGERFGMSRGALYKMHYDARKKLRDYLEGRGFDMNDVRFALDKASK